MAIGGSIFIVTLVIIQKSKYEDIGISGGFRALCEGI